MSNRTAFLDLYCERASASWWDEPLNVVTNLAFFVVACLIARQLKKMKQNAGHGMTWDWWVLPGLIALIGVGSLVIGSRADLWSQPAISSD
jgi:hypothetical protein